jgi:hypothetical protein
MLENIMMTRALPYRRRYEQNLILTQINIVTQAHSTLYIHFRSPHVNLIFDIPNRIPALEYMVFNHTALSLMVDLLLHLG